MPAQKWTTPEQEAWLMIEDGKWPMVKAGTGTLQSFYTRTAITFLQKWPAVPNATMLKQAAGDSKKAEQLAETRVHTRIANWFSNAHRSTKPNLPVSEPVLDLSGKCSRKRPPIQKWQAFSVLYYRPTDSPLREKVKSLFAQRNNPEAVEFLVEFLPPKVDFKTIDYLNFLGVYLRELCTHLSTEEEEAVAAYAEEFASSAVELQDRPWFLDDDFQEDPLHAENKYIQERIDELPRVVQRALDEIEKATGFKSFLLLGGLSPSSDGDITTHVYVTGTAIKTGLTFLESWVGYQDMHGAFVKWLQMAYNDEEKCRREGHHADSSQQTTPSPDSNESAPQQAERNPPTPNPQPSDPQPSDPPSSDLPPSDSQPSDPPSSDLPPSDPRLSDLPPSDPLLPDLPPSDPLLPDLPPSDPPLSDPQTNGLPVPPIESPSKSPSPEQTGDTMAFTPPPPAPRTPLSTVPPVPKSPAIVFEHRPSYPVFVTTAVIEHLNSVDGGPLWVEMVKGYLELEDSYPLRPVGKLSLRSRPQEVVSWGRERASIPSITDVQQFQEKWLIWWGSCQPKWRSIDPWPFSRDDAEGRDWTRLNTTGPHGLFPIVMSTSWWVSASLGSHRAVFDAAVTDLHWVIKNLMSFNSKSQESQPMTNLPTSNFPGHHQRASGKRKVKPTPKVCNGL